MTKFSVDKSRSIVYNISPRNFAQNAFFNENFESDIIHEISELSSEIFVIISAS